MRLLTSISIFFPSSEPQMAPLKTIGKQTIKKFESHKRQTPQIPNSNVPDHIETLKLLLDRSNVISTMQSDMAIIKLELSQVRAEIKLIQPPSIEEVVAASSEMGTNVATSDVATSEKGYVGMDDDEEDGSSESS